MGLVAFGTRADRLTEQRKGDALTIYGRLQMRRWESDGEAREQLQVVVETILSARTVARQVSGPTSRQGTPHVSATRSDGVRAMGTLKQSGGSR